MAKNVMCTKPYCDCIEKAEQAAGGPIKNYPCLADQPDFIKEKSTVAGSTNSPGGAGVWKNVSDGLPKFEGLQKLYFARYSRSDEKALYTYENLRDRHDSGYVLQYLDETPLSPNN